MPSDYGKFRRPSALLLFLCTTLLLFAGCRARDGGSPGREPQPFALTATEDTTHRVSKQVDAASGGTLETVDAQGTRYRLTIPEAALLMDTQIVVTPLVGLSGVPGQTVHYGVDIQPAGTRLYELAKLEITPATPLPKDSYWLETDGSPSRMQARPGFPAIGQPGVLLSHFSGGTVVGGTAETTAAVRVAGDGPGGVGSVSWLQWMRNFVAQDYQAGRIDKITFDVKNEIIENRLQEAIGQELAAKLARDTEAAQQELTKADNVADQGNVKDAALIHDAIVNALQVEAQRQYSGAVETELSDKIGALFFKWYSSILRNCSTQRLDPRVLVGMERDLQLLGYASPEATFENCVKASGAQKEVERALTSSDGDRSTRAARRALVKRAADRVAAYAEALR